MWNYANKKINKYIYIYTHTYTSYIITASSMFPVCLSGFSCWVGSFRWNSHTPQTAHGWGCIPVDIKIGSSISGPTYFNQVDILSWKHAEIVSWHLSQVYKLMYQGALFHCSPTWVQVVCRIIPKSRSLLMTVNQPYYVYKMYLSMKCMYVYMYIYIYGYFWSIGWSIHITNRVYIYD